MRSIVLAIFICGCPKPQPPHQDADAAKAATPENACAAEAEYGFLEGADAQCAAVLEHVVDAGLRRVDLACIVGSQSKESMCACAGGPRCE